MPTLSEATKKANEIIQRLEPTCTRIEVAGSIRRKKAQVKDIEIVAIPKMTPDLFGQMSPIIIDVSEFGEVLKDGQRYKQVELPEGCNLDLFFVLPPAQWGVIYTIRTGPAQFSKRIVTAKNQGGLLPSYARVTDGGVYVDGELVPMDEETDLFEFCDMAWIEPEDR